MASVRQTVYGRATNGGCEKHPLKGQGCVDALLSSTLNIGELRTLRFAGRDV